MDYVINFDSFEAPIECSGCGHTRTETIGVLRKNPIVKCPQCGSVIMFDSRTLDNGLRSAERKIEALKRNIRLV